MSHIAIDARIINSSTGRYVERLLHYLQEVDMTNDYTILVLEKDKDYFVPTNHHFTIAVANFKQYSLSEQIGFKKLLDQLSPDLVHFCMPQQPVLYKGKHVTTFHDMTLVKIIMPDKNPAIYRIKQFIGKFVFKRVAQTSEAILVPSEFTKDELVTFSGISPDKITLTYEGAEVHTALAIAYDQPFKHYIMYVGQEAAYKNITRLGDAHQRLIKKYPDLGLILVGKKDETVRANETYFADRNYKNILFTDFVSDGELSWLFAHTDAYIFPSLMEGFGLPGLEAMGHGAPVVSSSATCLPEVNGDAAHYFDPSDTTDIARAIDEVLSDKSLRTDLIKKGYEQIKKYSWRRMSEQTHGVYMHVLESTSLPEQS
jgi:glycosyltransferase involved in cell wall biosynthesis